MSASAQVTLLAIEVGIPQEGSPGPGEGHHGQGDWDGNIDSDLAHVNLLLELAGGGTIVGKDGCAISIWVPKNYIFLL